MLTDIMKAVTGQHINACHITTENFISNDVWVFDWIRVTKDMRRFPNFLANGNAAVDNMTGGSVMAMSR